jgi:hypothetical protein
MTATTAPASTATTIIIDDFHGTFDAQSQASALSKTVDIGVQSADIHLFARLRSLGTVMAKAKKPSSSTHSFDPPAEADWHRRISEAAYYRSQRKEFSGESALENWIAAETEVKALLSAEAKAPKAKASKRSKRAKPDG